MTLYKYFTLNRCIIVLYNTSSSLSATIVVVQYKMDLLVI